MVAINFPDSPTNGQEHSGYVWDATNNVWNRLPTLPALDLVNFSAVQPSNPQDGQFWFDTTAGKMYVYYNDGSSAQWVSTLGGLVGQTGTEGQQLIHNGTEWVAYDGGSRNLLYNGAMQVAQRGTSATGVDASGYYTADRWRTGYSGAGSWTQTVEADGPSGSGFLKSLKMECTTADASLTASDFLIIEQGFEGQDLQLLKKGTSNSESITLQFWTKSSTTGEYVVSLFDQDNFRSISSSYTVNSADTWEKKSVTFSGDSVGSLDNDNNLSLILYFWLAAGSDRTSGALQTSWGDYVASNIAVGQTNLAGSIGNYWQITGVQAETGTVANNFDHKSYGVELAECQRYYQTSYPLGVLPQALTDVTDGATWISINTSDTANGGALPVTMRNSPSFSVYSSNGGVAANSARAGSGANITGINLIGGTTKSLPRLNKNGGLLAAGNPLSAHWIADAEL